MADSTRFNDVRDAYAIVLKRSRQNLLTGCMEWFGMTKAEGYGEIRCNRRMEKTHRVAWMANVGPIPDGNHVLHHCDNPSCVEIGHLFLGTNQENIADKVKKDRSGKKLCIADVRSIKAMLLDGFSNSAIARKFGVNPCQVSRIKLGQRWSHV